MTRTKPGVTQRGSVSTDVLPSGVRQQPRSIQEIIQELERRAPSGTAEAWDNVGLLVGDPSARCRGVVVTVDLTREAIELAREMGAGLIVNHHPCIFPKSRGLSKILGGAESGKSNLIFEAIRSGIAIFACHTNFDRCALEVVERVAKDLKVKARGRLFDSAHIRGSLFKLVVFIPKSHAGKVRDALARAGAGHIGDYDSCSFESEGHGQYRGSSISSPFIGRPGELESTPEVRLETILPRGLERTVLQALRKAHPYEEMAYDLYPLEQAPLPTGLAPGIGYGFWGDLLSPRPFSEMLNDVKRVFRVNACLITENPPKLVRRLAFAAGQGSSFVESAAEAGCDLMITGEASYHSVLGVSKFRDAPMAVLQVGHRESERFFSEVMRDWLTPGSAGFKGFSGKHVFTLEVPTQCFL